MTKKYYIKKSVVIFFSVIFLTAIIFSVCGIIGAVKTFLNGGGIEDGSPVSILFLLLAPFAAAKFFEPQMTVDENGISYLYRKGWQTVPWSSIKSIHLTESNDLQIEAFYPNSAEIKTWYMPLNIVNADPLKLTEELQNILQNMSENKNDLESECFYDENLPCPPRGGNGEC